MQRFSIFIFGFGSYFFMVRYFPKEEFGIWVLFVTLTAIIEMSRSAFVQNAFIKFFNEPEMDQSALVMSSLLLNLASTILFIFMLVVLNPLLSRFWHTEEIIPLILWYCLTSLILVPFTQLNYVEQASHNFRGIFWSAVVRQGSFFTTVVIAHFFIPGLSLIFFAALQSVCALAGLVAAWILSARFVPPNLHHNWELTKRLFRFGKYILGTGVMSAMGKSTDQVILGSISHSTTALYNSAIRVMNFIEIPSLSISNIVYPKLAQKAMAGKEGARDLYHQSVASIIAIILPLILFIFFFADFVLLMVAGPEYVEAKLILQLIVTSAIMTPFIIQVGSACEVIGKPHTSFYINLVSNFSNLGLNLVLVPLYGAMGGAWSLVGGSIITFIMGQVILRRELNTSVIQVLRDTGNFYVRAPKEISKLLRRTR